jgi:hypothetical protein
LVSVSVWVLVLAWVYVDDDDGPWSGGRAQEHPL